MNNVLRIFFVSILLFCTCIFSCQHELDNRVIKTILETQQSNFFTDDFKPLNSKAIDQYQQCLLQSKPAIQAIKDDMKKNKSNSEQIKALTKSYNAIFDKIKNNLRDKYGNDWNKFIPVNSNSDRTIVSGHSYGSSLGSYYSVYDYQLGGYWSGNDYIDVFFVYFYGQEQISSYYHNVIYTYVFVGDRYEWHNHFWQDLTSISMVDNEYVWPYSVPKIILKLADDTNTVPAPMGQTWLINNNSAINVSYGVSQAVIRGNAIHDGIINNIVYDGSVFEASVAILDRAGDYKEDWNISAFINTIVHPDYPKTLPVNWNDVAFYGSIGTYFADVSGDGKADAIALNNTIFGGVTYSGAYVRCSTGFGFGTMNNWTGGVFYGSLGTYFADVNGDGKADAIALNNNATFDGVTYSGAYVRCSTGSGFGTMNNWTGGVFYGSLGTYFADVNGDGKADAIALNNNATFDGVTYSGAYVRCSTGSGFGTMNNWTGGVFYGSLGTYFADVNGDGKADAIAVNDDGVYVRCSTGLGFDTLNNWTRCPFYGSKGTYFIDVNGDGKADAIAVNDDGVYVRCSSGSEFLPLGY